MSIVPPSSWTIFVQGFSQTSTYFFLGTHFVLLCEQSIRYFVQKYATWDTPCVSPSHFLVDCSVGERQWMAFYGRGRLRQARIATYAEVWIYVKTLRREHLALLGYTLAQICTAVTVTLNSSRSGKGCVLASFFSFSPSSPTFRELLTGSLKALWRSHKWQKMSLLWL